MVECGRGGGSGDGETGRRGDSINRLPICILPKHLTPIAALWMSHPALCAKCRRILDLLSSMPYPLSVFRPSLSFSLLKTAMCGQSDYRLAMWGLDDLGQFLLERWHGNRKIRLVGAWDEDSSRTAMARMLNVPIVATEDALLDPTMIDGIFLDVPREKAAAGAERILSTGIDVISADPPVVEFDDVDRLRRAARSTERRVILHPVLAESPDISAARAIVAARKDDPPRLIRYESWSDMRAERTALSRMTTRTLVEMLILANEPAERVLARRIAGQGLAAWVTFPSGLSAELSLHVSATVQRPPAWTVDAATWGYRAGRLWTRASDGELFDAAAPGGAWATIEDHILAPAVGNDATFREMSRLIALEHAIEESLASGEVELVVTRKQCSFDPVPLVAEAVAEPH